MYQVPSRQMLGNVIKRVLYSTLKSAFLKTSKKENPIAWTDNVVNDFGKLYGMMEGAVLYLYQFS